MGARRKARELALQMLFQHDLGGNEPDMICSTFEDLEKSKPNTRVAESTLGKAWPLPCNWALSAVGCLKTRVRGSKLICETRGQRALRAATALDSQAAGESSLRSGSAGGRGGGAFAAAAGVVSRSTRPTASALRTSTLQV